MPILIATLLLYIFFCSLFLCGFYKLSRSQQIIMPDGSLRTEGFLLKWWSEFWEQTSGVKAWQYSGDQLEEKFRVLLAANKALAARLLINPERMSFRFFKEDDSLSAADRKFIEDYAQVRVFVNGGNIFFYLDEPTYRFPKWVRLPVSGCPICFSSPFTYGGLLYWIPILSLNSDLFTCFTNPLAAKWLLFLPFCIALSFLNFIIARKYEL